MPPLEPITDLSVPPLSLGDVTFSKGMGEPLAPLESVELAARPSWWKEGDWELKATLKFRDNKTPLDVPFRAMADAEDIPLGPAHYPWGTAPYQAQPGREKLGRGADFCRWCPAQYQNQGQGGKV